MPHENFHKAVDEIIKLGDHYKSAAESASLIAMRNHTKQSIDSAKLLVAQHDTARYISDRVCDIILKYFG